MTIVNWSQFIGGLIKHSIDIPKIIELGQKFVEASWADKWPAFKELVDLLYPIILDMGQFSAQSYDATALEAQLTAQSVDLAKLNKLWDLLSPILIPILMDRLKQKQ